MPQHISKGKNFTPQEDSLVFTQSELDNYKTKKERKKEAALYRQLIRNFSNNHGGFTFLTTEENILQSMNPATVGRLAYL